ncbi:hypothetical protein AAGS61_14075 [Lysinibacillus sp. KU-BSD001]|uniref:hypothetical protein n=1 Tax=Lysinibacillus sp. KU-BSD001 TaxID=3141328 RepID=UPI0036EB3205
MDTIKMVVEQKPINILHHTYNRECRYTRGLHIPIEDFQHIINRMCPDTKTYFEFHNVATKMERGEYLNGYAGLARNIVNYYKTEKGAEVAGLNDGRDFYVKIV